MSAPDTILQVGSTVAGLAAGIRTHREVLAIQAVASGRAWQRMTKGGVWHDPRAVFESSVYGIGNHTLHEMICRGFVSTPEGNGPLGLTDAGWDALNRNVGGGDQ